MITFEPLPLASHLPSGENSKVAAGLRMGRVVTRDREEISQMKIFDDPEKASNRPLGEKATLLPLAGSGKVAISSP